MDTFVQLLVGTVVLRPYVVAFLLLYLFAAVVDLGWRRTVLFTVVAWSVAFTAESLSIRFGVPFGLYHYLPTTAGKELWIAGVPFMDSLSFVYLAYASWTMASLALLPALRDGEHRWALSLPHRDRFSVPVLLLTVVFFVLIDVVLDPMAVRGDRWFLGQIFYYPQGGVYFGVPASNFLGWGVVGSLIMILFALLERSIRIGAPAWARRLPLRPLYGPGLYCIVLAFALTVTWLIGEQTLVLVGLFIYGPLTTVLAVTVTARWRQHQRSSAGHLERMTVVLPARDAPANGRGSLPVEPVWRDPHLE